MKPANFISDCTNLLAAGLFSNYGFNGMEKDNETASGDYDFGARNYDSRLGRWKSVDPYQSVFPSHSPYNFALNSPIQYLDGDGRLVIYANGLRFGASFKRGLFRLLGNLVLPLAWATPKLGDDLNFPNREGVYKDYSQISGDKNDAEGAKHAGGYWNTMRKQIRKYFHDDNEVYVDGTNLWWSGESRYKEGQLAAETLDGLIKKGEVKLEKDETIKIVGHSQGARYAAGMAKRLKELGYTIEEVDYLAPHQPTKIKHPLGIPGYQFSRRTDAVTSTGIIPNTVAHSKFGPIPSLSQKNIYTLPSMKKFFSDGFRGHSIDTYVKEKIYEEGSEHENTNQEEPQIPEGTTPDIIELENGGPIEN